MVQFRVHLPRRTLSALAVFYLQMQVRPLGPRIAYPTNDLSLIDTLPFAQMGCGACLQVHVANGVAGVCVENTDSNPTPPLRAVHHFGQDSTYPGPNFPTVNGPMISMHQIQCAVQISVLPIELTGYDGTFKRSGKSSGSPVAKTGLHVIQGLPHLIICHLPGLPQYLRQLLSRFLTRVEVRSQK